MVSLRVSESMASMAPKAKRFRQSSAASIASTSVFDEHEGTDSEVRQGEKRHAKGVGTIPLQEGKHRNKRGSETLRSSSVAPIGRLAVTPAPRAFELLARQPTSLIDMTPAERNAVVVTAVVDASGTEHVLSRFGDDVWDLSPEIPAKNKYAKCKKIRWPSDVPRALVDDAKAAVYCALRQNKPGVSWSASTAASVGSYAAVTLRYLALQSIETFSQVRSLHVTDYIADLNEYITASSIQNRLSILDAVRSFEAEMIYPLPEHPYAKRAIWGWNLRGGQANDPCGRTGRTPVIPPSIQKSLWMHCEAMLADAEAALGARDAGELAPTSDRLMAIRNAVLYQLQITSGMRNSEAAGVTNDCWRDERRTLHDGRVVFLHWVRTKEVKTSGGMEMDYLVPGELIASLKILQRVAKPLQQRLADEALWLQDVLASAANDAGHLSNGMTISETVQRLNHVREIGQHMLLGISTMASDHLGSGSRVEVIGSYTCVMALSRLTKSARLNWDIGNHQCRRTFAWNVANSRLGRMGLVFIKWQFKHASISWTQLYAANPRQDQALYQEFGDAMWESKVELLASWHEADVRLSGGAGKKLMQTRATPVRNFNQLLRATADSVNLRSTGHAWCMSGTQGCQGQGLYDPTMCGGCSQAVIDDSQASRWQMIHLDNLRLAAIADCGPAVEAKAKRAVELSTRVLVDLGVALPTSEQAKSYEDRSMSA